MENQTDSDRFLIRSVFSMTLWQNKKGEIAKRTQFGHPAARIFSTARVRSAKFWRGRMAKAPCNRAETMPKAKKTAALL
jgi:hypothetical protein